MITTKQVKEWIRQPYAWPGGYQISAVTSDGDCICHVCARKNWLLICDSMRKDIRDSWHIAAIGVIWEGRADCTECGQIVSVYGEIEEESEDTNQS